MPGGDGTGPMGMGAMTGRAAGYCAGYPVAGYMNPVYGRGGFGYGRGFGRGFGRGRGFGWRGAVYPYGNSYGNPYGAANVTPQTEAQVLREQASAMQEEINAVNARLKELESSPESQRNE